MPSIPVEQVIYVSCFEIIQQRVMDGLRQNPLEMLCKKSARRAQTHTKRAGLRPNFKKYL